MIDITLLLGICLVLLLIYFYSYLQPPKRIKELGCQFPGPTAYPFFGNLLSLGIDSSRFTEKLEALAVKHGSIFRLILGRDLLLFVSNPEDIETVLGESKQLNKSRGSTIAGRAWIGEGLLIAPEEKWKQNRKRLAPAFHVKILENFISIFNKNVDLLVEHLNVLVDGPDFNVSPLVAMFALRNICETAMGVSLDSLPNNSAYPKAVEELNRIFAMKLLIPLFENKTLWSMHPLGKKEKELLNYVHSLTEKVIKSRKEENKKHEELETNNEDLAEGQRKRMIFLDLLLNIQKSDPKFSDQQIRDEVDTFMFAGHDTVSVTIAFCIYLLSKNREIQDKIYEEVQDILQGSDRPLEYQDLQEMKYLEKVIKETLRRYTSVPAIGRHAFTDIKLKSGLVIPTGAEIICYLLRLHNDPKVFPNPTKFDPENFSLENIKNRHPFAYLPFGGGPRDCIGMKYAMSELKVALFNLIKNFIFLPSTSQKDILLISEIVLKSQDGISVKVVRR